VGIGRSGLKRPLPEDVGEDDDVVVPRLLLPGREDPVF
jgi:hypothetical protein